MMIPFYLISKSFTTLKINGLEIISFKENAQMPGRWNHCYPVIFNFLFPFPSLC